MTTTLQAIAASLLALLPGALAVWWFERYAAAWGIGLPDRLLRFVGVSAVFHAVAAPLTYWIWKGYLESGRWESGNWLPWSLWLALLLYVVLPIGAGTIGGLASNGGSRWIKLVTGPARAPRAWDSFFFRRPDGWMRLKLKSGTWIGGAFTQDSYAAGYPEAPDLLLAAAVEVDPASGAFLFDEEDRVRARDSSILVRWEEIEYLEFVDA